MNFTKSELKDVAKMIEESILKESMNFDTIKGYQQTESYKIKSALYVKILSEYYGSIVTINENSMFGLLDIN